MVCWPCLGLPTRWIWWPNTVIKGVKWCVKGLTFDLEYLTLKAKTQNSALTDLCVWSFCTCLCIFRLLGWKLYDKLEKMSKNGQNWPVYRPWWPWPSDLDHSTRKSLFLRCIHLLSFVEMGKWERGQNPRTYGRRTYVRHTPAWSIYISASPQIKTQRQKWEVLTSMRL